MVQNMTVLQDAALSDCTHVIALIKVKIYLTHQAVSARMRL